MSLGDCLLISALVIPSLLVILVKGMIVSLFFNRILSLLFLFFWGGLETWAVAVARNGISWSEMGWMDIFPLGVYWLLPHGDWWVEQATLLVTSEDTAMLANGPFETVHFGASFALLFAILTLIFRRRDV